MLGRLAVRYPEVPIIFAGSRKFAEEWAGIGHSKAPYLRLEGGNLLGIPIEDPFPLLRHPFRRTAGTDGAGSAPAPPTGGLPWSPAKWTA
jgi:hypothetical protein